MPSMCIFGPSVLKYRSYIMGLLFKSNQVMPRCLARDRSLDAGSLAGSAS